MADIIELILSNPSLIGTITSLIISCVALISAFCRNRNSGVIPEVKSEVDNIAKSLAVIVPALSLLLDKKDKEDKKDEN